ncbi:MAG: hypothetical protein LBS19_11220 [Clostridiales bacterium]|jgi:hypothetical protein|nr:hypothetical protein [Clostridiales bacterium]
MNYGIYIAAAVMIAVIAAAMFIITAKRCNTRVYAMIGGEYLLIHSQRVSARAHIIDLSPPEIGGKSDEFMLVFSKNTGRDMKGRPVKIVGKDGAALEQDISGSRHFRIISNEKMEEYDYDDQG